MINKNNVTLDNVSVGNLFLDKKNPASTFLFFIQWLRITSLGLFCNLEWYLVIWAFFKSLRRPHSREINSYITNNVRMILNDLLYFHLLFKVIRQTTGWRGGVRSTATSSTYWQAKKNRKNLILFTKKHSRPNVLFMYFHICCFDIMVKYNIYM